MFRKRECCLQGERVVLVPYSAHHVERYHRWMQDPTLRAQTASDPLTLQEEHAMQASWLKDTDKCTFIVLDKELYKTKQIPELDCMVGDVNMFLSRDWSHDQSEASHDREEGPAELMVAEIDIMIAEPSFRGKGLGVEATSLMLAYGVHELGVSTLRAKVGVSNTASFNLFKNKLGFKEVSRSEVFQEITLELSAEEWKLLNAACQTLNNLKWTKYTPRQ